jgi:hypothetical protein
MAASSSSPPRTVRRVRGRYARSVKGTSVCARSAETGVASGAVTQPPLTQFSISAGSGAGAGGTDCRLLLPSAREETEGDAARAISSFDPLLGASRTTMMKRASSSKNNSPVEVRTVGSEVRVGSESFTVGKSWTSPALIVSSLDETVLRPPLPSVPVFLPRAPGGAGRPPELLPAPAACDPAVAAKRLIIHS